MKELALCKQCAKEKGFFDPHKLSLAENAIPSELSGDVEKFIRQMLDAVMPEGIMEPEMDEKIPDMLTKCPTCHYTLGQFRDTGLLGCPDCYKVFGAEIDPTGEGQDADDEHDAEIKPDSIDPPTLERGRLELLLQKAVIEENYEEAARLRDLIKKIPET